MKLNTIKRFFKIKFDYLFFREYRFRREVRRHYLPYYSHDAARATNDHRIVVSMYDGKRYHGGLADRLRGITTIYKFCKDNGIDYRIYFVSPFDIRLFLSPNKYDWRIEASEISYNIEDSLPVYMDTSNLDVKKDLAFQRKITRKFLTNRFRQTHVYSTVYYEQDSFREMFLELFRPTQMLQEAIDEQLANIGGKFVSVSTRFLELLGDFNERKERSAKGVVEKERADLIDSCLAKIAEIRGSHPEVNKVLVTSDSETFVKKAKETFGFVYVIPGRIGHLDVVDGSSDHLDIHLKTFVDFFTLSHSEAVYLIATGRMYKNSGFSQRAAQLGNRPFKRILF